MKPTWIAAIALAVPLVAGTAVAQTTSPPATQTHAGAFDRLSPGNQKIASALFDAQQDTIKPLNAKPLSLDDIAALKRSGTGWGQVFRRMKAQGLVQDKNLGQVVSQFNHESHTSRSSATLITTGSGKTVRVGGEAGSERAAGFGKGLGGGEGERGASGASANRGTAFARSGSDSAVSTASGGGASAHGAGRHSGKL